MSEEFWALVCVLLVLLVGAMVAVWFIHQGDKAKIELINKAIDAAERAERERLLSKLEEVK
jgi:hypothetical protein